MYSHGPSKQITSPASEAWPILEGEDEECLGGEDNGEEKAQIVKEGCRRNGEDRVARRIARGFSRKFFERIFIIKEKNVYICAGNCLYRSVSQQCICEKVGK